ncbi:uncharacterized protein [Montipora capricornis]|uniref:uncharacterized protein n=1 Tax=Montipora capricornis TaxID=246305 RepID=UPI0035F178FE
MHPKILILSCIFFGQVAGAPSHKLLCQVCEGTATSDAENAKDECDRNIRMETCPPEMDHPVCAAFSERGSFKRLCLPKEQYKLLAEECDKGEGLSQCEMAMCEQSGCEASGYRRRLSCPVCQARGTNLVDGKYKCDRKRKIKPCLRDLNDPVCATITNSGSFKRMCLSKEQYETLLGECDESSSPCKMAMCRQSGCRASVMVSPDDPFSCPACYAEGPNALDDCEETNKLLPCKGYHSVCYTQSNKNRDFVARGCSSREYYRRKEGRCNMKGTCVVSMCDTSGCTAGLL